MCMEWIWNKVDPATGPQLIWTGICTTAPRADPSFNMVLVLVISMVCFPWLPPKVRGMTIIRLTHEGVGLPDSLIWPFAFLTRFVTSGPFSFCMDSRHTRLDTSTGVVGSTVYIANQCMSTSCIWLGLSEYCRMKRSPISYVFLFFLVFMFYSWCWVQWAVQLCLSKRNMF